MVTQELEEEYGESWQRVRNRLRAEVDDTQYRSWLKPLSLHSVQGDVVYLCVSSLFVRDWIKSKFLGRLIDLWQAEEPDINLVDILVRAQPNKASPKTQAISNDDFSISVAADSITDKNPAESYIRSNDLSLLAPQSFGGHLDSRCTFDSFVVGAPNELAYAAARRVAEKPNVTFNPLFLYGGVGLGKTHLMHAIAWHITKTQPERKVIYLSGERFMYQFINALRHKTIMDFKEAFRSVDVLMIDDIHFIAGRAATQEEFFHTFNALADQQRQIVISADRSPSDMANLDERLRSRLGWGLVADLQPTDYELRLSILHSKAEELQAGTHISKEILAFLAHNITTNVRELEGSLKRLIAHASLVGKHITIETARSVLHDLLKACDRQVTINDIQNRVADYFNINRSDMFSARRSRVIARPRQIAMFLSKEMTTRSLPDIAKAFHKKDHTTVMHAVNRISSLLLSDSKLADDMDRLRRVLQG